MTLLLFNNMVQSDSQIQDKKHRDEWECQSWVTTLKSRRDSCLTMYVTADAELQSLMKNRAETKQIPQETFEAVSKLSGQYMEANSAWLEAQTTLEKRKLEERKMMLQAQEVKALLRCFADFADFSDAVKRGSRISSERSFRQNGQMSAILYCMAAYCSTVSHILPHSSIQIICYVPTCIGAYHSAPPQPVPHRTAPNRSAPNQSAPIRTKPMAHLFAPYLSTPDRTGP